MQPCGAPGAHPVLCLDICNGYAGRLPGYDQFLYRYYFTGAVGDGECCCCTSSGVSAWLYSIVEYC